MTTLKSVNVIIQKTISPFLELVKGNGYFYFVYDDGKCFNTYSVYVKSLSQLSLSDWTNEAKEFYGTVNTVDDLKS